MLIDYIMGLYDDWTQDRASMLEPEWYRNLAAYQRKETVDPASDTDIFDQTKKDGWKSDIYVGITRTKVTAGSALVIDNLLQEEDFPFTMKLTPTDEARLRSEPPQLRAGVVEEIIRINADMKKGLLKTRSDVELAKMVLSGAIYGDSYAKITPDAGLEYISCWDIVRDWTTDDVRKSQGVIQRHKVTAYEISELVALNEDIMDADEARTALKTGVTYSTKLSENPREDYTDDGYHELLECHMRVPGQYLEEDENAEEDPLDWRDVVVYILNGMQIGLLEDPGTRPFYHVPWQMDIDSIRNIGIPDNIADVQESLNKAMRMFEDNKYLVSKVTGFVKPELLDSTEANGFDIEGGTFYKLDETVENAQQAIQQLTFTDVGQSLLSLIQTLDVLSDEHSMIPKIAHGAQGSGDKTAYEAGQQIDKAGKYIASIIRNFDEYLIEPFITDVYEIYDMDFGYGLECQALGYSSYNDRVIKSQKLMEFMQLIMQSPEFAQEFSLSRVAETIGYTQGVDTMKLLKTSKEKEEEQQQNAPMMEMQQQMQQIQLENAMLENEKLKAEIEQITEEAEKTNAETEKLSTETIKIEAETDKIDTESGISERAQDLAEYESLSQEANSGAETGSKSGD